MSERFWKLINFIVDSDKTDLKFLESVEEEDKIFPDIEISDWTKIKVN